MVVWLTRKRSRVHSRSGSTRSADQPSSPASAAHSSYSYAAPIDAVHPLCDEHPPMIRARGRSILGELESAAVAMS